MGYLLDINNALNGLSLSETEVIEITAIIDSMLESLAVQAVEIGNAYTSHGAAAAIIAVNEIAKMIRDKKVNVY